MASTDLYLVGDHFILASEADASKRQDLLLKLKPYNTVIVNVLNTSSRASRKYGISEETLSFLEELDPQSTLI